MSKPKEQVSLGEGEILSPMMIRDEPPPGLLPESTLSTQLEEMRKVKPGATCVLKHPLPEELSDHIERRIWDIERS